MLVNVSKHSATLFKLSFAFIFLLKLFQGQIYSVPKIIECLVTTVTSIFMQMIPNYLALIITCYKII